MISHTRVEARARHDAVLAGLRHHLDAGKRSDLERCADRLAEALGTTAPGTTASGTGALRDTVVLAMYGGGKDSSFMLAAARYMQLYLEEQRGETFRLRTATNHHSGMPAAVAQNIHRAYAALDMYDDPLVELLSIFGNSVSTFEVEASLPESIRSRDRLDVLMNAHRCEAAARPTFCNRCNLNMENAVALAVGYGHHADVVITGDSPLEQKRYLAWVRRAARTLGNAPAQGTPGLRTFLTDLAGIEERLSGDVLRTLEDEARQRRLSVDRLERDPLFFSIYDDTTYRAGDHWPLITGFLGFVFDEIAFSFTESDCGNPGLMAHLHALRHERVLGLTYDEGLREYVQYATGLMRRKEFPEQLIEIVSRRYAGPDALARMRQSMRDYAVYAFGLTEEQLVCMIFAPFADAGKNLRRYLEAEQPELLPSEDRIRDLLAGRLDAALAPELDSKLTAISGLAAAHRRVLFESGLIDARRAEAGAVNPISIILKGDPHKAVIERRTAAGEAIRELITGR